MKNLKVLQQQLKEVNEDLKPLFKQSNINSTLINKLLRRKYNLQININQMTQ